jgi:hypothetical protein
MANHFIVLIILLFINLSIWSKGSKIISQEMILQLKEEIEEFNQIPQNRDEKRKNFIKKMNQKLSSLFKDKEIVSFGENCIPFFEENDYSQNERIKFNCTGLSSEFKDSFALEITVPEKFLDTLETNKQLKNVEFKLQKKEKWLSRQFNDLAKAQKKSNIPKTLQWNVKEGIEYDPPVEFKDNGYGRIVFRGIMTSVIPFKIGCISGNCENGEGHYVSENRSSFKGTWKNGYLNGQAEVKLNNGDIYIGSFNNGERDGIGEYKFSDGGYYKGEFNKNEFFGKGEFKYSDGSLHVGIFTKSKRNGEGIYYDNKGEVIQKGIWKNDEFVSSPLELKEPEIQKNSTIIIDDSSFNLFLILSGSDINIHLISTTKDEDKGSFIFSGSDESKKFKVNENATIQIETSGADNIIFIPYELKNSILKEPDSKAIQKIKIILSGADNAIHIPKEFKGTINISETGINNKLIFIE